VGNGGDRGACRTLAQTRLFAYHPRSGLNFDFEKEPKWELYLNERRTTTREFQKKIDADYESPCNQLAEGHSNFFSRRRYPPRARCSVRFQKWSGVKTRMDGLFLCGGFDNRLDNRRQTVIVEFLFNQTSWFHACKYHATLPGVINFTVAALPPLVLLGPCDSPPSALQCASGNVSCLEIWGAKKSISARPS
jgi:hypothetical protein